VIVCFGIISKKWSGEAPETADGMRTLKAFDLHSDIPKSVSTALKPPVFPVKQPEKLFAITL